MSLGTFREYLKSSIEEEVIRQDKDYCELELKDGNNVFIEKRNGKYVINCTKSTFSLCRDEMDELAKKIKDIK